MNLEDKLTRLLGEKWMETHGKNLMMKLYLLLHFREIWTKKH